MNKPTIFWEVLFAIILLQVLLAILSAVFYVREEKSFYNKKEYNTNTNHLLVLFVINPFVGMIIAVIFSTQLQLDWIGALFSVLLYSFFLILVPLLIVAFFIYKK